MDSKYICIDCKRFYHSTVNTMTEYCKDESVSCDNFVPMTPLETHFEKFKRSLYDSKLILFLFKNMLKSFFIKMNWVETVNSYNWIKFHMATTGRQIYEEKN